MSNEAEKIEILCAHALNNLPDSIRRRGEILSILREVCPEDTDTREAIEQAVHHFNEHQKFTRMQLPLFGS